MYLIIIPLDVPQPFGVTLKPRPVRADLGFMDIVGAGLSGVAGILIFALVAAGVARIYQIGTTLSEIKELLASLKRDTQMPLPQHPFASTESAEQLLRAVSAELDHPVPPAAVEHRD
jgi:hypothetical protein